MSTTGSEMTWVGKRPPRRLEGMSDAISIAADLGFSVPPPPSQETVSYILSIGSVGSLLGAILYQYSLKEHPFRDLLFWTQLLFGLSGILDLALVLRLNLKFGIPDYFFVVMDESVYQMIGRLKWMPLLVLSAKLCPPGIEEFI